MNNKKYIDRHSDIARIAKALGHPARIAILEYLAQLDHCFFGEISDELPISKATVSQHLKELKDSGLIVGIIDGPKVRYYIDRDKWDYEKKQFEKFFANIVPKIGCCSGHDGEHDHHHDHDHNHDHGEEIHQH